MESSCRGASLPAPTPSPSRLASQRPSLFAAIAMPWQPPPRPFRALLVAASAKFPHFNAAATPTACMSASLTAFATAGGGGGGNGGAGLGGGGGGGGGGGSGGEGDKLRPNASGSSELGAQPDDVSLAVDAAADVIFLSVGGMSCGGCASSVKNILESQPHVASASVNLSAEIAIVKVAVQEQPLGKQEIAEALAKHLTNCGFKSSVREELIGG